MPKTNISKTPPKGSIRFSLSLSEEQKKAKTEILKHPFNFIVGKAGSGKTLMAIAAGLEQTLGFAERKYKKIVVSRPVQPMGKDIGFLPGTMEEKMAPWMKPIFDNMQYIMGSDRTMLDLYLEKGVIEIDAITYIRGRSISNAYVIIDEA